MSEVQSISREHGLNITYGAGIVVCLVLRWFLQHIAVSAITRLQPDSCLALPAARQRHSSKRYGPIARRNADGPRSKTRSQPSQRWPRASQRSGLVS